MTSLDASRRATGVWVRAAALRDGRVASASLWLITLGLAAREKWKQRRALIGMPTRPKKIGFYCAVHSAFLVFENCRGDSLCSHALHLSELSEILVPGNTLEVPARRFRSIPNLVENRLSVLSNEL